MPHFGKVDIWMTVEHDVITFWFGKLKKYPENIGHYVELFCNVLNSPKIYSVCF